MSRIVSVDATHTFVIRGIYVRSIHRQELTDQEIHDCLMQQTSVTEYLPDGTTRRLDLSNYKSQPKAEAKKVIEPEVKATEHVAPVETETVKTEKTEEKKEAPVKETVKETYKKNNKK